MKLPNYTQQDLKVKGIVLPLFVLAENWILLGNSYWRERSVFVLATLLMAFFIYVHWFINNAISLYFHRVYPHYRQVLPRVLSSNLLACLNSCLFTFMAYGCLWWINPPGFQHQSDRILWGLAFVVFTVFMVSTIYETINFFEHWQKALVETEQLKKDQVQRQLENLKSQINPHFLFNSLNSLSSLIEEDPEQAEQFVDEMSSVYRYLLRSNQTELVALANEIAFAQSYFHLLSTRYGQSIQLIMHVADRYHQHQIPPLTLQLLLENAVKHNVILPEQPLCIWIETVDDRLIVRNNLQRKTGRILSNRVGLANIMAKYRLLGAQEVIVREDEQFFTVSLPLIGQN